MLRYSLTRGPVCSILFFFAVQSSDWLKDVITWLMVKRLSLTPVTEIAPL